MANLAYFEVAHQAQQGPCRNPSPPQAIALAGAARGLAIDGDHLGRRSDQRSDPGDEATLERLGVNRGEDVAQVIMRRRPIAKWPEAAQKRELLRPEPGDINKVSAPASTPSSANKSTSSSGYTTLPRWRGSGKSSK